MENEQTPTHSRNTIVLEQFRKSPIFSHDTYTPWLNVSAQTILSCPEPEDLLNALESMAWAIQHRSLSDEMVNVSTIIQTAGRHSNSCNYIQSILFTIQNPDLQILLKTKLLDTYKSQKKPLCLAKGINILYKTKLFAENPQSEQNLSKLTAVASRWFDNAELICLFESIASIKFTQEVFELLYQTTKTSPLISKNELRSLLEMALVDHDFELTQELDYELEKPMLPEIPKMTLCLQRFGLIPSLSPIPEESPGTPTFANT